MQYYFFRSVENTYAAAFKQLVIRHNVVSAKVLSLALSIFAAFIVVATFCINQFHLLAHHVDPPISLFFIYTSVVCYSSIVICRRLHLKRRYTFYRIISSTYAMALLLRCIWISFKVQHNPANTMAVFLIGILSVAILWLFTARETIAIALFTWVIFLVGLPYFHVDVDKLWQNLVVATLVITCFFCISRIVYSYHYNYFIQLKTIERKNYEISRMDKNKTEMLGMVAHDLRSPIQSITALIDLSVNHSSTEDEKDEYYQLMLKACMETDNIIHDLIEVAKGMDEGLTTTTIGAYEFLNSIKQQWIHRMPGSRQLLLQDSKDEMMINIHPQKMQRVIDNLINNAIKFTPDDGTISLHVVHDQHNLRLSISDNGIGIPLELQPFLFDRFSRAGRNGLNGEKSHGLGLSICKQIVEQHNGLINVNSEENKGTTFIIDLPLFTN